MKYTVEVNSEGIFWYKEGTNILHREDGPAVECFNGDKAWWINGKRHREDGPAVEWTNGTKYWYVNGQCHRIDGPAYECARGYKCWFYQGQKINCNSQEQFENWLKEHHLEDYNRLKGITTSVSNCADKIINVNGTNYKLVRI